MTEQLTYRGWCITLRPGAFVGYVALVKLHPDSLTRKKFRGRDREQLLSRVRNFVDDAETLAEELSTEDD